MQQNRLAAVKSILDEYPWLVNHAAVLSRDRIGLLSIAAAQQNSLPLAALLIDANAPVNQPNGNGQTALMVARERQHCEFVEFLLQLPGVVDHAAPVDENPFQVR